MIDGFAPGPFTDLDLTDPRPAYAPTFAPLASSLSSSLSPWHTVLDVAYAALALELLFDLGGALDDTLGAFEAAQPQPGGVLDTSSLTAAATAYSAAYGQVVEFFSNLPPDAFDYQEIHVNPTPGGGGGGAPGTSHPV